MDERARQVADDAPHEPLSLEQDESFHADESFRDEKVDRDDVTPRPRSVWRPLVVLVAIALAGIGLYRIATTGPAPKEQAGGRQGGAPQPVGAATIGTGTIKIVVNALGTVTPIATVTIKPQVSGQLVEVNYVEGQLVDKGDLLAQIDPRPFQLAEQQYQGQLLRDQGLLDQARMNLVRYQTLLKQNSIPRQQAEDQAFVVKQYEGAVRADQAQIDAQRLNLTYARIVAPIRGRIGLRLVDIGNYVQTSDTGLAVITQIDPISVIFTVPEDELALILAETRAGTKLEVAAYDRANINRLAVGKLAAIDNQIDTTTGTVKLRAEFANRDDQLFPNRFVIVRLLVKSLEGAVTVPATAVQRGAPGTYVYRIEADDTVAVRPVELGPTDAGMIAVTSGLSPGDRVVVDGADRLRDGARILIPSGEGRGAAAGPSARPDAGPPQGSSPRQGPRKNGPGEPDKK